MTDMTPAPISVERLRELLAKATALPWEADAGTVRPAPESPDRVTIAYCSGEGSPQGEADAELIAAAINALPALLHQLAELERDNATMRGTDYHQVGVEQEQEIIDLEAKLAEREAEVAKWRERSETNERLRCEVMALFNGAASDLRAAERAREEACGLLRDIRPVLSCADTYGACGDLRDRIAAFLAANK